MEWQQTPPAIMELQRRQQADLNTAFNRNQVRDLKDENASLRAQLNDLRSSMTLYPSLQGAEQTIKLLRREADEQEDIHERVLHDYQLALQHIEQLEVDNHELEMRADQLAHVDEHGPYERYWQEVQHFARYRRQQSARLDNLANRMQDQINTAERKLRNANRMNAYMERQQHDDIVQYRDDMVAMTVTCASVREARLTD